MKLSCLPVSLYADFASGRRSLGGWLRLAAELGLDGADVSVAHLRRDPEWLAGLRRESEDAGVPVVMIATYSDFTQADAAERARQEDEVRAWVEAAHRLGARFLRLTAGQDRPDVAEEDGLAWAAAGLTACMADAAAAGVTLLYENHVRGAVWGANDFTQPAARFLEVARRTEAAGLQVLFDTANPLALSEDPRALLAAVRERVGAVHLSDIRAAGSFEPVVLGTGASPIPELVGALVRGGFEGWLSVEEASRSGEDGLRRAVAYAREAWAAAGGR